jgi:tRNA dimethylallyltransferase
MTPAASLPLFIAGPTASGKSALAFALASRLDGEIISVDSMQVYRGLDIGTAKPSAAERAAIPHHLLDVVELNQTFSAADFCRLARIAEDDIRMRGRVPIFCGGTGLYFRAYLEGLDEGPPTNPELRETLQRRSMSELVDELLRLDSGAEKQVDLKNPRRVIRALERIKLTGKVLSAQRTSWSTAPRSVPFFFVVGRQPSDLHRRLSLRVDEMFQRGLVEETRRLLEAGLEKNPTAMQALGYRQVVEHLRGVRGLAETIELVKIKTRQFAKRQKTWFRKQAAPEWIVLQPHDCLETLANRLADRYRSQKGAEPG